MAVTAQGQIIGRIVLEERELPEPFVGKSYFIANLLTHADFRRQGVARALILALTEELKNRGSHCLTLEVRASNDSARALYESLGFVLVGTRRNYYHNPKEDALILRKEWEI